MALERIPIKHLRRIRHINFFIIGFVVMMKFVFTQEFIYIGLYLLYILQERLHYAVLGSVLNSIKDTLNIKNK